jgi:hypothetical protein
VVLQQVLADAFKIDLTSLKRPYCESSMPGVWMSDRLVSLLKSKQVRRGAGGGPVGPHPPSSSRSTSPEGDYLPFLPVPPPDLRGLPASLRLARHAPSLFRLRGSLPPPGDGT